MNTYPLVFTCREMVAGKNFTAAIDITGRALMEFEDGSWTVVGVEPGGFADCGDTAQEAYNNFRVTLKTILLDAVDAHPDNFQTFCSDVRTFGGTRNADAAARWDAAREEIRAGGALEDPFAQGLPKRTNTIHPSVQIWRMDVVNEEVREKTNTLVANENLSSAA